MGSVAAEIKTAGTDVDESLAVAEAGPAGEQAAAAQAIV
jgi:hypothetical protein